MDHSKPQVVTQSLSDDFAAFGAKVPAAKSSAQDDAFGISEENWQSFIAFLDCETQWRVIARGKDNAELVWTGLDYTAVDTLLRRRKLPDAVFDDLQFLERAALKAFAEATR